MSVRRARGARAGRASGRAWCRASSPSRRGCALAGLALCLGLALPATPARADDESPALSGWDRFNAANSDFNYWMTLHVIKPLAKGYNVIVPKPLQTGIDNVLINLQRPRDIVNSLLQGRLRRAGRHTGSLLVNSTLGLGGLVYASEALFWDAPPETFNETLGVWGVPTGPYTVLPLVVPPFNSASPRSLFGAAVDAAMSPTFWVPFTTTEFGGYTAFGVSTGVLVGGGLNSVALLMPPPWASESEWQAFETLFRERTPYPERKQLFYDNQAFDVED